MFGSSRPSKRRAGDPVSAFIKISANKTNKNGGSSSSRKGSRPNELSIAPLPQLVPHVEVKSPHAAHAMARHTSIKFATETMRRAGLEAAVGQRTTHSSKSAPLAPEILAFDPQSIMWRQAGVRYTDSQVLPPILWYAEGGRWTEGPNFPGVGVHPAYDYERPRRDARSRWFREVVTSSPTRRTMLNRLRLCMEEILKCPDFPWPLPHSVASTMYERSSLRPTPLTTADPNTAAATAVEPTPASLAVSSATATGATVPPPPPQTLRWHHKPSAETLNMPPASHDALLLAESVIDEHRLAGGQAGGRSPGDLPVRPELARREFRQEFFRAPAPPPTAAGPRPLAPALPPPLLLLTQKHRAQEDPAHILQIARQQQLQLQLQQSQLAEKNYQQMADTSGADELLSLYADNEEAEAGEENEAMDDQEDDEQGDDAGDNEETTSEVEEGEVTGNGTDAEPASDDQGEGGDSEDAPTTKPSQAHDYVSAVLSLSQKGAQRKAPTAVTVPAAATKSSPAKKPAAPRSNGGGGGGSKKRKTPEPAAAAADAEEGAEAEATEEAAAAAPPKKKRAPAKSKAQRQKEAATSANKAAGIDHEASPSDSVVDHINDVKANMEEITQLRQDMAAFTQKVGLQLASMDPQQAFEKISEFLAGLLKTTDPDVLEGVSDLIAMLVDHATILPLKSRATYGSDLSEARQKEIKQERVTMGKVVHVFGRAPNATPGPNPFDWKDYRKRYAEKKKREAAEAAAAAKAKSAAAAQAKKAKVSSIADENPF